MPHDRRATMAEIVSHPPSIPPRRDVMDWALHLRTLAPAEPHRLIWILARLLADRASPDALLTVSDGLVEAAAQTAFDGDEPAAAGLRSIAALIGDQAKHQIPRGAFW